MASTLRIVDLNGKTINIFRGQDQSWAEVVSKAKLPARFDFCLRHWMSDDAMDAQTEERIKAYLDRVGYILIQDKPDATIITDYKELRDKVALIPVSGYPQLENLFYGNRDDTENMEVIPGRDNTENMTQAETKVYDALTKPRRAPADIEKRREKRKRIDAMRAQYPDAEVVFMRVDTANEFEYGGRRWRIDGAKQYEPKVVHGDLLYDMDQVACIKCGEGTMFYDQDFNSITGHVTPI